MSAIKKPFFTGRIILTQGGYEVKHYFAKITYFFVEKQAFLLRLNAI